MVCDLYPCSTLQWTQKCWYFTPSINYWEMSHLSTEIAGLAHLKTIIEYIRKALFSLISTSFFLSKWKVNSSDWMYMNTCSSTWNQGFSMAMGGDPYFINFSSFKMGIFLTLPFWRLQVTASKKALQTDTRTISSFTLSCPSQQSQKQGPTSEDGTETVQLQVKCFAVKSGKTSPSTLARTVPVPTCTNARRLCRSGGLLGLWAPPQNH